MRAGVSDKMQLIIACRFFSLRVSKTPKHGRRICLNCRFSVTRLAILTTNAFKFVYDVKYVSQLGSRTVKCGSFDKRR